MPRQATGAGNHPVAPRACASSKRFRISATRCPRPARRRRRRRLSRAIASLSAAALLLGVHALGELAPALTLGKGSRRGQRLDDMVWRSARRARRGGWPPLVRRREACAPASVTCSCVRLSAPPSAPLATAARRSAFASMRAACLSRADLASASATAARRAFDDPLRYACFSSGRRARLRHRLLLTTSRRRRRLGESEATCASSEVSLASRRRELLAAGHRAGRAPDHPHLLQRLLDLRHERLLLKHLRARRALVDLGAAQPLVLAASRTG